MISKEMEYIKKTNGDHPSSSNLCSRCDDQESVLYCSECDAVFCEECSHDLHSKGRWKSHTGNEWHQNRHSPRFPLFVCHYRLGSQNSVAQMENQSATEPKETRLEDLSDLPEMIPPPVASLEEDEGSSFIPTR